MRHFLRIQLHKSTSPSKAWEALVLLSDGPGPHLLPQRHCCATLGKSLNLKTVMGELHGFDRKTETIHMKDLQ